MPRPQDIRRFNYINADTLTTHFAALDALRIEYNLDASRVWNLDETGCSPGKDTQGQTNLHRLLRRNTRSELRAPNFSYNSRVTLMPCISAGGDAGPPLFAFKGARLPYRVVIQNGVECTETLSTHLPQNSLVNMREVIAGVDGESFHQWAKVFTDYVSHLTENVRHVLLIYDAYRSHLSLRVLQQFEQHRVVVYALPSNTAQKTQPCDALLFAVFKNRLNHEIIAVSEIQNSPPLVVYDICKVLNVAYECAFIPTVIKSSFAKCGIWPVDRALLSNSPPPLDAENTSKLLSVDELEELYTHRRLSARQRILRADIEISRSEFVDTSKGAVLSSLEALRIASEKCNTDARRRAASVQRSFGKEQQE